MQQVDANPEHFAGAYMNPPHTALCVFYVGSEGSARQRLAGHLPDNLPVAWIPVRHSYAELSRVRNEIVELAKRLGPDKISGLAVRPGANRVIVFLPRPQPEFAAELRSRYGDLITIEIAPAPIPG